MESPSNPEVLNFNHKKMKKNGYTDVIVDIPVTGIKKGETVYVSATEFGQLPSDAMVTCITSDDEEIIIPKKNLKIK